MTTTKKTNDSFLHEAQKSGKGSGKESIEDLDAAIDGVHKIANEEAMAYFRDTSEDKWDTVKMAVYCHDCREIVPGGMDTVRGKTRVVCGRCKSRKISMGREEALRSFYHLEKAK